MGFYVGSGELNLGSHACVGKQVIKEATSWFVPLAAALSPLRISVQGNLFWDTVSTQLYRCQPLWLLSSRSSHLNEMDWLF